MVLEATMIIIDNSEHSRNGDYLPTRFDAQHDCANLIFTAKTGANPESSVGLMSLAGSQPEVLTTLTTDQGRIVDGLHRIKVKGVAHLGTALNVAGLALKHRQNKSQHPRIIVFVCSPIEESEAQCVKLAKKMRKVNIAVDVVCFGDVEGETAAKVQAFHENIKTANQTDEAGDDASHLAVIPPGPNLLSDSIVATNILAGSGMGPGAGGQGGGGGGDEGGAGGEANGFEFGIDPSADPELALALRMSMEEEERRQREQREREQRESGEKLESVPEAGEAEAEKKDGEGPSGADGASGDKKDGEGGSGAAGDKMDTS